MDSTTDATQSLEHWPYRTYNWGRWSNGRGTLNLVDRAATRRGFDAVVEHRVLDLGAPLREDDVTAAADYDSDYHYELLRAGRYAFAPESDGLFESGDRFTIATHGMTNTHIDAFCHVGHRGRSFNGEPSEAVVSLATGVQKYTVTDLGGFATRAWLVDVPAQRGQPFLRPGDPVVPEDLAPFEGRVEPGDAVVIRTGRFAAPLVAPDAPEARDNHGNWSGLHVDCIEAIARWDAATVATDGPGDNFPSTTEHCSVPIHVLTEVYLGLPLMHHLDLEALAEALRGRSEPSFLLSVAPLKIEGGTGSPVNPLATI